MATSPFSTDYEYSSQERLQNGQRTDMVRVQRRSVESQKVTKTTKVVTTRTREALSHQPGTQHTTSCVITTEHTQLGDAAGAAGAGVSDYSEYLSNYALPSAPSVPQIVDFDASSVTLTWLPPDRDGDSGYLEGYLVQYRLTNEDEWFSANAELIQDTQYTVRNLQPNGQYEFRILAKNSIGFGEPSNASPVLQLKPNVAIPYFSKRMSRETNVPARPGKPRVLSFGSSVVELVWESPIFCGAAGPVLGYDMQYRPQGNTEWSTANDYLVQSLSYTVQGLKPGGSYEFRVLAKNVDGYSPPSQTVELQLVQGDVREPAAESKYGLPDSPSQLQVIYVDSASCTLLWFPSTPQSSRVSYIVQFREIGNPTWFTANTEPIYETQYTVEKLHANSTYEFRVFAQNDYGVSQSYVLSEIVQLRPTSQGPVNSVPPRPGRPEVTASEDNTVTLTWQPVVAPMPVQGYQVEYCTPNDLPLRWTRINSILTKNNGMTIGDLTVNQEYQFRVTAKNSIGYSPPSDPSLPISVLEPGVRDTSTLPVEINETRESPPITDTDDSPPPLRRFSPNANEVQYRDPTLPEVIDYLSNPNNIIKLNATGYLQHLTFNDDSIKQKVRALGGIQKLVTLLNNDVPEIQRNACGCLRNLSFGHPENKISVLECSGVQALGNLLKRTPDVQVVEEVTGTLWNLSSCFELKPQVYTHTAEHLIQQIVVPYSGWTPHAGATGQLPPVGRGGSMAHPPLVFRNAIGILRNISSADDLIRRALREKQHLTEAIVYFFYNACFRQDYDSKTIENVACLLRNLSYRLQEVEDPNYDRSTLNLHSRSRSAPAGSPKIPEKKSSKKKTKTSEKSYAQFLENPAVKRVALLFSVDTVKNYLLLLQNSTNPEVLEASAGAIQNLAACEWQPSLEVRTIVRKEKGLPILVELLRTDTEKVKCASAKALRNLAFDLRNKELIGKYAMAELVSLLPASINEQNSSEDTIITALSLIYTTTSKNPDFTRACHERGGTERLVCISRNRTLYSSRVVMYTSQVLLAMWQHKDLHDMFYRSGFKDEDFLLLPGSMRGSVDTLMRPVGTPGIEKDFQQRFPVVDNNVRSQFGSLNLRSEPIIPAGYYSSLARGRPDGSFSMSRTSLTMGDPLYTEVQKNRNRPNRAQSSQLRSMNAEEPAGDSWV